MNRFYNRRVRTQFVPMDMQELMMVPQLKTKAHMDLISSSNALKNLPINAAPGTSDFQVASEQVNRLSNNVDAFVENSINQGLSSQTASGFKDLIGGYGHTKKYVDAANYRYGLYQQMSETLDEAAKKDPTQTDWVNMIRNYNAGVMTNTPMNLNPDTGEFDTFDFVSYVNRPDIPEKFEEAMKRVLAGSNTTGLGLARDDNGRVVPGFLSYGTIKGKNDLDLILASKEIAADPEIVSYLSTLSKITGGQVKTGLEEGSYFMNTNEDGQITKDKKTGSYFRGDTILGRYAEKAFEGHNNPEIDLKYIKGSKGAGYTGGGSIMGPGDYTVQGHEKDARSDNVFNSYLAKQDALETSKANVAMIEQAQLQSETSWLNGVLGSADDRVHFGIGTNGYNQSAFTMDSRMFVETLGGSTAFENAPKDQTFKERVASVRKELLDAGVSESFMDAVLSTENKQLLGVLEQMGNQQTRLNEEKVLASVNETELNTWRNKIRKTNPEFAATYEVYEGEVDAFLENLSSLIKTGEVGYRDAFVNPEISDEEALKALENLRKDLLRTPYYAAKHYDENNVTFKEARLSMEEVFEKYEDVFNLVGSVPFNTADNARRQFGAMGMYPIRKSESLGADMFRWMGFDVQRGGESRDGRVGQGPNPYMVSYNTIEQLWNMKRSVEDLADMVGKTGVTAMDSPNSTYVLSLRGNPATDAGKTLNYQMDMIKETVSLDLPSLISSNMDQPVIDIIAEQTGFKNPMMKASELMIYPSITEDDNGREFIVGFTIDGVARNGDKPSEQMHLTKPIFVRFNREDTLPAGFGEYVYSMWLGENQNPTADITARKALNMYFGQNAVSNSQRLKSKFYDNKGADNFQMDLHYAPLHLQDLVDKGYYPPYSSETMTFQRVAKDQGYRWNVTFSGTGQSVLVDDVQNLYSVIGERLANANLQFVSTTEPYNYYAE